MTDEELKAAALRAIEESSQSWICNGVLADGVAVVYSPSLGLLRKIVHVAETAPAFGPYIAAANPATVLRLLDELDAAKAEVGRMLEAFHHEAQNHRRALLATEVEAKKRYAAEDEVERLRELLGTAVYWWEAHAENYAEQMDKPICEEEAAAIEAARSAASTLPEKTP